MILTPEERILVEINFRNKTDPGEVEYSTIYPSIRPLRRREMIDFHLLLQIFDLSEVFRILTLDSHR